MDNPERAYYANGNVASERWYENDQQHRLNGPARIYNYEDGNIEREDWYENDQLHRLNGPAVIFYYKNGKIDSEYWWINGNEINPPYDNYPLSNEQQIEMKLTYG